MYRFLLFPLFPAFCKAFGQHHGNEYGHWSGPIQEVDVAIIGGGSSGMYTATRLHQMNKTVAVIEQRNQTGGHVDTYTDPVTGQIFDVGVLYYHNISVVTDFASYLDIPMQPVQLTSSSPDKSYYIDFSTGNRLSLDTINSLGDTVSAFIQYYNILGQYPYLLSGFHLPSPVPEDLVISWQEFIVKHNLSGLAFDIDLFNQGWNDILHMPTLYVLKGFGQLLLNSFFSGYELETSRHNNQELFDAAVKKIGSENVHLSSTVLHVQRSDNGVEMIVKTASGLKLVRAVKLLVTALPLVEVLQPFMSLDEEEKDLFSRFSCGYYWNAVVRSSGLPDDVSLYNAGQDNSYYIASQPGVLTVIPSGVKNLHRVYYGSPDYLSDDDVPASILSTLARALITAGFDNSGLSIAYIRSHSPYHCTVSAQDITNGFYDKLNGLQGKKSTYYTGATFQAHDSGSIWLYIENETLPALLNR